MSLTQEQCETFWNSADKNGDGFLTIQELAVALSLRGYRDPRSKLTDKDIAFMFNSIDKSQDHKISKAEFFDEMSKPLRSQTLEDTFTAFDKDGNGSLSRSELEAVVRASKCFKPEEIQAAIAEIFNTADINHDGSVSLEEFLSVVS
ncbi:calmodulin-like protein 3 [Dreissena polymorpha]|uniref:Sulfhydryl light chain n=1 Tax=Dreissena polymorpha TaxID=45954 RepID=A0A9D4CDJ7_DREPO|nr:calmodulin-like protein 3 [Dreissena polymorpha]XP_052246135.1 calmodulin-like protein 3 [Dreissena polymorpha]XP_052246138.1 calmodulin-like protein 3 [Dreissena polymorpha]XP_052246139.1 calmodulin-like protein 3 [Dreissena polymorpha]XP_052246140.1 calmodulin-like protein 3 [Dreissena polymorpha]XP_052246141.1 calmodulin-like protein 3 [Dreissena polymorpha]KAH3721560.1 hypothetical protein DPMN_064489 [Dreissena polymorpha]